MKNLLLALLLNSSFHAHASQCADDLINLFAKTPDIKSSSISKAQEILGAKALSEKKVRALEKSIAVGNKEIYTPSDIVTQTNILRKAGYTPQEIQKLRANNILPNSAVHSHAPLPTKIDTVELDLKKFGVEEAERIKRGEKISYVIDDSGQPYVLKKGHNFDNDTVWIAQVKGPKSAEPAHGFMVREAGTISYNNGTKKFEFNTNYGVSGTEAEMAELTRRVSTELKQPVTFAKTGKPIETKAYECLDILSAQSSGKNLITSRIVPDNAVAMGGIALGEAFGAGRMNTEQGREVIAADMIGTNLNVLVGGYISSKLILNNSSFLTSMGTRAAVGMGMIQVQKHIYEGTLSTDAQERAETIATFDQYHFAGRLAWNHMFDKFMVGKTKGAFNLPNLIYKACQNNSRMRVLVNPQTVRFIEKSASAAIYYGLRKSIIDE